MEDVIFVALICEVWASGGSGIEGFFGLMLATGRGTKGSRRLCGEGRSSYHFWTDSSDDA